MNSIDRERRFKSAAVQQTYVNGGYFNDLSKIGGCLCQEKYKQYGTFPRGKGIPQYETGKKGVGFGNFSFLPH